MFILFNGKDLTFSVNSAKRLPFDKAEAYLAKLDSVSNDEREFAASYDPDRIQWQIEDKM